MRCEWRALRSPDRARLPGRVNGAFGDARDGASATIDVSDQPSGTAATKGREDSGQTVGLAICGLSSTTANAGDAFDRRELVAASWT